MKGLIRHQEELQNIRQDTVDHFQSEIQVKYNLRCDQCCSVSTVTILQGNPVSLSSNWTWKMDVPKEPRVDMHMRALQ